jgi:hypothetical protein
MLNGDMSPSEHLQNKCSNYYLQSDLSFLTFPPEHLNLMVTPWNILFVNLLLLEVLLQRAARSITPLF